MSNDDDVLFQADELELPRPTKPAEPRRWKKVQPPQTWRPNDTGEEIVGIYRGKTKKTGSHGQYEVILVDVTGRGRFLVSGVACVQGVDTAGLAPGEPIKIIYRGTKALDVDRTMKMFDVYVEDR